LSILLSIVYIVTSVVTTATVSWWLTIIEDKDPEVSEVFYATKIRVIPRHYFTVANSRAALASLINLILAPQWCELIRHPNIAESDLALNGSGCKPSRG
jgi:hypothetical protein